MIFNQESIKNELLRWKAIVGPNEYSGPETVGLHEVLDAHFLLQDHFSELGEGIGGIGPRDVNILHSTLARQFTSFGGRPRWANHFEVIGTLFFGLICNHPFHDCNKRTALLTSASHLDKLGRVPEIAETEYEELAVRTAEKSLHGMPHFDKFRKQQDPEIKFLAYFFRNNSRPTNRRSYFITYQELGTILRRFDCRFGQPDGNFIHVEKLVTKRHLIFQKRTEWQSILQIRFPGLKSEVGLGDLKRLRRALELTPEHGIDSEVFFHGSEPLQSFIRKYQRPLRRLANK
jgi:prophage maintenance system killer protein